MGFSSTFAKIEIVGNAGRDAESRNVNGKTLTKFSVAADHGWGDKRSTTFFNVTCFGKTAEFAAQDIKKGMPVVVVGEIYERKYEKDGVERRIFEVDADSVTWVRPPRTEGTPAAPKTDDDDWG